MTNTNTNAETNGMPIGWFEIGTDDPDTARSFYGEAFGWTFAVDGPYSIITTGAGHPLQGGIQDTSVDMPEGTPPGYAIPYVVVPDTAAMCERVEKLGGKVLVPATKVEAMGLVYAHVADPAGNHIGLFTPSPA